jgi:serine/threonine protein kinase/Flp pilus assembly protein TadD
MQLRYEEARKLGRVRTAEELCQQRPELIEELRKRLQALEEVNQFLKRPPTAGPDEWGSTGSVPATSPSSVPMTRGPGEELSSSEYIPPTDPGSPNGSPRAPVPLPQELQLPGYEMLGVLGKGAMGKVYKARDRKLNRVVALKVILAQDFISLESLTRFQREAEAQARLHHPNIVQIYSVGEHNGGPFLALEYVEGGTLSRRLAGEPQEAQPAAWLIETLARAVHFAHLHGIVHRDLKPGNVLLQMGEGGRRKEEKSRSSGSSHPPPPFDFVPKVSDFGLAKRLDQEKSLARTGDVLGTPQYMAPEQARGDQKAVGPAADVYALGAILYEMLTGRPPFRGTSVYDTLALVVTEDPVPPSRLQPKVPRDLETICLKCLEKLPGRRYASAEALADDLARFQAGETIQARPASRIERALKWARRCPAAAALVVVSVFALVAGITAGAFAYEMQVRKTRAAEKELLAEKKLQGNRENVRELIGAGKSAADGGNWPEAEKKLLSALALLDQEPELVSEEERASVQSLLDTVRREQEKERMERKAKEEARAKLPALRKALDQALFYQVEALFNQPRSLVQVNLALQAGTPVGYQRSVEAGRRACLEGLAQFALDNPNFSTPDLNQNHFDESERKEIAKNCYVLLVARAAAEAQPLSAQVEERQAQTKKALAILDQAQQLHGGPTKALHLYRADFLKQLGRNEAAAAEEREAAQKVPADATDYFLIGLDYFRHGRLPDAIRAFQQTLLQESNYVWAHYFIGLSFLRFPPQGPTQQAGNCERARTHLTAFRGLSQEHEFPWVFIMRGWASGNLAKLNWDKAIKEGNTENWEPFWAFWDEAERLFDEAEKDFQMGEAKLKEEANDDAAYVLAVQRGVVRLWAQDYTAAEAELKQAIALRPGQYNAYVNLAQVYLEKRYYPEALEQLNLALERAEADPTLEPTDRRRVRASLYRTRAYFWGRKIPQPDTAQALADLDRALQDEPDSQRQAEDLVEKGYLLRRSGQLEDAVAVCDVALETRENFPAAHELRAWCLLELSLTKDKGLIEEASQAFEAFLHWGPPSKPEYVAQIYQALWRARIKSKDYTGAIDDLGRVLFWVKDPTTLIARGKLYLAQDASDLALRDFEEALRLRPHDVDALAGRALALLQLDLKPGRSPRVPLRYAEGVAALEEELAKRHQKGPLNYLLAYHACRVNAQALRVANQDPAGNGYRSRYKKQALAWLETALNNAPNPEKFWRDLVLPDGDLYPIRGTYEFRILADRFGSSAP